MSIIWINDLHWLLLSFIGRLLIDNNGMQPRPEAEDVMPNNKREKRSNKRFPKTPRLCNNGSKFYKINVNLFAWEHASSTVNSFFHTKNILFLKP